ncbi:uncharacterized protein I303_106289 [Kwoniella dejecticola CBS 10117]|uniref:Uncharacterized protein n=1 Tax=Kwoniella dejecticola CBS 10117 TaxID=1296121 RepID=A0A1A6A1T9_9TREE|nr:uncharacterized protein I303_06309 [Kwoniella dejecticola CBS 10117]OBR84022.1 hypothetical protein I303_06309 [Kwoniella dejecticola CBS 10117]
MSHLYDRKKPRSLYMPELWASWDFMLDQSERESKLIKGTLGKASLPEECLVKVDPYTGQAPSEYPIIRTDYDIQYNDILIANQNARSYRFIVIRDIWFLILPIDIPGSPSCAPWAVKGCVQYLWDHFRSDDSPMHFFTLSKRLSLAGQSKGRANIYHQNHEHVKALWRYLLAWMVLFPYHMDAFPANHASRLAVARLECNISCDIMATMLEVVKITPPGDSTRILKMLDVGYRAGMGLLFICFPKNVGFMQRALRRIDKLKEQIGQVDKNNTLAPIPKILEDLYEGYQIYCKDRDPDEKLEAFDNKKMSFSDQLDILNLDPEARAVSPSTTLVNDWA